jgi:putative phosphoesterase
MHIALISDIHGNMIALEAVLADIERNRPDRIICLGDVATLGPRPRDVIEVLRELSCPCIMGNHDEFLIDAPLIHTYDTLPIVIEAVEWCRGQLSERDLNYITGFKRTLEVPVSSSSTLLLFHGTPRSHMEVLLATTPADEVDALLGDHRAEIMAGGHTHVQMIRQHRGMFLLNPGSVGLPFKEHVTTQPATFMAHAEYATIELVRNTIKITAHRVPLDKGMLQQAIARTDNPVRDIFPQRYE